MVFNNTCSENVNYVVFQAVQWKDTDAYHVARAVENGNLRKVQTATNAELRIIEPKYNRTMLMLAIMHRHYEIAKHIVERVGLVNSRERYYGSTPIILACGLARPSIESVEFLLNNGADIHSTEQGALAPNHKVTMYPLAKAVNRGNLEVVKFLIREGSDVDRPYSPNGYRPLSSAIPLPNELDIAKLLI